LRLVTFDLYRPAKIKVEASADLRVAAHFGIETVMDLKLREIEKNS
jgi:hypothetical protein